MLTLNNIASWIEHSEGKTKRVVSQEEFLFTHEGMGGGKILRTLIVKEREINS